MLSQGEFSGSRPVSVGHACPTAEVSCITAIEDTVCCTCAAGPRRIVLGCTDRTFTVLSGSSDGCWSPHRKIRCADDALPVSVSWVPALDGILAVQARGPSGTGAYSQRDAIVYPALFDGTSDAPLTSTPVEDAPRALRLPRALPTNSYDHGTGAGESDILCAASCLHSGRMVAGSCAWLSLRQLLAPCGMTSNKQPSNAWMNRRRKKETQPTPPINNGT